MVDPTTIATNVTSFVPDLQPMIDIIQPLIIKLSVVLGGLFGLYIILGAMRVYYERRKVIILEDIRYNLNQQNLSKGIRHAGRRRTIKEKIFGR